ncbi:MAG: hypothetical protein J0H88_09380 [Sphingomonadales bacterium]|nr:hypothetical protein [Sphingomonadales bacterium]
MAIFIISYDLRAPGRNYDGLHKALRDYAFAKPLESFWLIESTASAGAIRNTLKAHIDKNDRLVVIEFTTNAGWATFGIQEDVMAWWQKRRP